MSKEARHRAVLALAKKPDFQTAWDLTEYWVRLRGQLGDSIATHTLRSYRRSIRDFLLFNADANLADMDSDGVYLWMREMQRAKLSPSTIRVRIAGAGRLYGALYWGGIDCDPFRSIKAPRDTVAPWDRRGPYSLRDVETMWRAASRSDRAIVMLGAHGGLRACEMVTLKWADVDFRTNTILVRGGKGAKSRRVPMSKNLTKALWALPRNMGYVVPVRTTKSIYNRVERLAETCDVEFLGVHSLRHSAGTRLVAETGSLEDAARILGHNRIETTRIYAKWSDTGARKAIANW